MPKSQREAVFTVAALHQWDMGIDDPRCVETAEEWFSDTIGPVATGGPIPSVCSSLLHLPCAGACVCFLSLFHLSSLEVPVLTVRGCSL